MRDDPTLRELISRVLDTPLPFALMKDWAVITFWLGLGVLGLLFFGFGSIRSWQQATRATSFLRKLGHGTLQLDLEATRNLLGCVDQGLAVGLESAAPPGAVASKEKAPRFLKTLHCIGVAIDST